MRVFGWFADLGFWVLGCGCLGWFGDSWILGVGFVVFKVLEFVFLADFVVFGWLVLGLIGFRSFAANWGWPAYNLL